MQIHDHITRRTLDVTAPLLWWALHFFTAYVFVALACGSTLIDAQWLGYSAIRFTLLLSTIVVALLAVALLWRAIVLYRNNADSFLPAARLGCAILGAIGIVWTSMPMFILSTCAK